MNRDERAAWQARLVTAMRLQNMKQRELAESSGVSEKTINDMVLGKKIANEDTLLKVAAVLDVEATPGVMDALRNSWPENVRNYSDIVGLYLMNLPEGQRDDAGDEVIRLLLARRNATTNGHTP